MNTRTISIDELDEPVSPSNPPRVKEGSPLIRVKSVSVKYPNGFQALKDINFDLYPRKIYALLGGNGSGKSTLFKSIMGLVKSQGLISVMDSDIEQALKANQIAYVPQTEDIDFTFPVNVWQVVMMARYARMSFLRIPSAEDKALVKRALMDVELLDFAHRQIGELSGGQKKRVFVARALAQQAKILLLDEPFSGVDVHTENQIIGLLSKLRDQGCLILITTHNLESVSRFCDEVILIRKQLIAKGHHSKVMVEENLLKAFC